MPQLFSTLRDHSGMIAFIGLALAILVVGLVSVGVGVENHVVSLDAAGIVLLVSIAAVAIERVVEFVWTAVSMTAGSTWPMRAIGAHLTSLTDSLDQAVAPYFHGANAVISRLNEANAVVDQEAARLRQELAGIQTNLEQLKKSAKDSQQLAAYAAAAANAVNLLNAHYGALLAEAESRAPGGDFGAHRLPAAKALIRAQAEAQAQRDNPKHLDGAKLAAYIAAQGHAAVATWETDTLAKVGAAAAKSQADPLERVADEYLRADPFFGEAGQAAGMVGTILGEIGQFMGAFKDNPGRRLLSIELGAFFGVAVAGLAGLDVFSATLQNIDPTHPIAHATALGAIATGLVIGLGASPTHEVIRVLQEYKVNQKAANAPHGGMAGAAVMAALPVGRSFGFARVADDVLEEAARGPETAAAAETAAEAAGRARQRVEMRSSAPVVYFR